jgi:hypothetical protein
MSVAQCGHHPLERLVKSPGVCVGGGPPQSIFKRGVPVSLDHIEVGAKVLKDVPGKSHGSKPRGAVVG